MTSLVYHFKLEEGKGIKYMLMRKLVEKEIARIKSTKKQTIYSKLINKKLWQIEMEWDQRKKVQKQEKVQEIVTL